MKMIYHYLRLIIYFVIDFKYSECSSLSRAKNPIEIINKLERLGEIGENHPVPEQNFVPETLTKLPDNYVLPEIVIKYDSEDIPACSENDKASQGDIYAVSKDDIFTTPLTHLYYQHTLQTPEEDTNLINEQLYYGDVTKEVIDKEPKNIIQFEVQGNLEAPDYVMNRYESVKTLSGSENDETVRTSLASTDTYYHKHNLESLYSDYNDFFDTFAAPEKNNSYETAKTNSAFENIDTELTINKSEFEDTRSSRTCTLPKINNSYETVKASQLSENIKSYEINRTYPTSNNFNNNDSFRRLLGSENIRSYKLKRTKPNFGSVNRHELFTSFSVIENIIRYEDIKTFAKYKNIYDYETTRTNLPHKNTYSYEPFRTNPMLKIVDNYKPAKTDTKTEEIENYKAVIPLYTGDLKTIYLLPGEHDRYEPFLVLENKNSYEYTTAKALSAIISSYRSCTTNSESENFKHFRVFQIPENNNRNEPPNTNSESKDVIFGTLRTLSEPINFDHYKIDKITKALLAKNLIRYVSPKTTPSFENFYDYDSTTTTTSTPAYFYDLYPTKLNPADEYTKRNNPPIYRYEPFRTFPAVEVDNNNQTAKTMDIYYNIPLRTASPQDAFHNEHSVLPRGTYQFQVLETYPLSESDNKYIPLKFSALYNDDISPKSHANSTTIVQDYQFVPSKSFSWKIVHSLYSPRDYVLIKNKLEPNESIYTYTEKNIHQDMLVKVSTLPENLYRHESTVNEILPSRTQTITYQFTPILVHKNPNKKKQKLRKKERLISALPRTYNYQNIIQFPIYDSYETRNHYWPNRTKSVDSYWNEFMQVKRPNSSRKLNIFDKYKPNRTIRDTTTTRKMIKTRKPSYDYWDEFMQIAHKIATKPTENLYENMTSSISVSKYNIYDKSSQNAIFEKLNINQLEHNGTTKSPDDYWDEFMQFATQITSRVTHDYYQNINDLYMDELHKTWKWNNQNGTYTTDRAPDNYKNILGAFKTENDAVYNEPLRTPFTLGDVYQMPSMYPSRPFRISEENEYLLQNKTSGIAKGLHHNKMYQGFRTLWPSINTILATTVPMNADLTNFLEPYMPTRTTPMLRWNFNDRDAAWPNVELILSTTEQTTADTKSKKTFATYFPFFTFLSQYPKEELRKKEEKTDKIQDLEESKEIIRENFPCTMKDDYTQMRAPPPEIQEEEVQCYMCGMNETDIPLYPTCVHIFNTDSFATGHYNKEKYRFRCRASSNCTGTVKKGEYCPVPPRKLYRGGCFKRYVDVGEVYNERGCRTMKPLKGKTIISKRLAALEYMLLKVDNGCATSPFAFLTPYSRTISLYVRYHVCVCKGRLCNKAQELNSGVFLIIVSVLLRICI